MDHRSKAFVELSLKELGCTQKELALRVGVSPTQVSKWKNGESMSLEMEERFEDLLNLESGSPEFVAWAGSKENAAKWEELILRMGIDANDDAETGYHTLPLLNEEDDLCSRVYYVLSGLGVECLPVFPAELEYTEGEYDDLSDDEICQRDEEYFEALRENPITSLIHSIFRSMNDIYGFFTAYVNELLLDEEHDYITPNAELIEHYLLDLAAVKVAEKSPIAKNFQDFRYKTLSRYQGWIVELKHEAMKHGFPLRAEIQDLISAECDQLGHDAERESLGFNAGLQHPDIYMNELLYGVRENRRMLTAIMEKLNISEEDLDVVDGL